MGSTAGTGTVTQRETGEYGVRATAAGSSGRRGKEVLCTTDWEPAGGQSQGLWPCVQTEEGSRAADAKWVGRRIKIMAGASVGGGKRPRARAEMQREGRGTRADCAVLTRAGPMQGARAVECNRGALSAAGLMGE